MTRHFNISSLSGAETSPASRRNISTAFVGLTTSVVLAVSSCVSPNAPSSHPDSHRTLETHFPEHSPGIPVCTSCDEFHDDIVNTGKRITEIVRSGVTSVMDFSGEIIDRFSKRIAITTSPDSRLLDTLWVEEFPVTVTVSANVVDRAELSTHGYFLWRIEKKESTGVFNSSYEEIIRSQGDSFVFTLEEDGVYRVLLTSVSVGDTPLLYTTSITIRKNIL